MLIQITNQCDNNCPHCLHNSVINGGHMTMEVFEKALELADELDTYCIVITGGEPFMHPQLFEMCQKVNKLFVVASNGNFIKNPFLKRTALAISRLPNYESIQVTSVRDLYPNYWDIRRNKGEFNSIPGITMSLDVPIYIKNLGRAKDNYPVDTLYPGPSCTNGHLIARQTNSLKAMGKELNERGIFCKPLVDWQGNIHLSESWLCPSIGDVFTPYDILWQKLKDTPPCKKCANWKALASMPKYSRVVELLK